MSFLFIAITLSAHGYLTGSMWRQAEQDMVVDGNLDVPHIHTPFYQKQTDQKHDMLSLVISYRV
jgi:hypothetical protein